MDDLVSSKERQSSCRWVLVSTIIYLLLFPFLFFMSLFSFMAFDNPHMTTFMGLLFIFLFLCISLSIPVSIFFMWRRYFQMQYSKVYFHCAVPIITAFVNYFLIEFLGLFVQPALYYANFTHLTAKDCSKITQTSTIGSFSNH